MSLAIVRLATFWSKVEVKPTTAYSLQSKAVMAHVKKLGGD